MGVVIDIGGMRLGLDGLDEGLDVAVRSRYQRFLVGEKPDLEVALEPAHAPYHQPSDMPEVRRSGERAYSIKYGSLEAELDLEAGRARAKLISSVYIVDSLLRIAVSLMALERDTLLLHSSGVRVRDQVLVCFGPSGVGKTTTARSVPEAQVLCDEMMLVRAVSTANGASTKVGGAEGAVSGDQVRAAGTPFHGDYSFCQPGEGPLLALVRLVQSPTEKLEPLSPAKAARALLACILFFCTDEQLAERLLALALRISQGRTYSLSFRRETHVPSFVDEHLRRHAAAARAEAPRP